MGGSDCFNDLFRIDQLFISLFKLLVLTRGKICGRYLIDFELKEGLLSVPLLLTHLLALEALFQRAVCTVKRRDSSPGLSNLFPAVSVKQRKLVLTPKEFLMFTLPVYIKQERCTLPHISHRACLPVDPENAARPFHLS